jgi:hypothetical protein
MDRINCISEIVPTQITKIRSWRGGTAPLNFNLGIRWSFVVTPTLRSIYSKKMSAWYPIKGRGMSPMVGMDVYRKRDYLAPDGQLHKYIVLIYTNYIKITITLNAKSASRICSSPRILATPRISYASLNKTDIRWVQHKPDTHMENVHPRNTWTYEYETLHYMFFNEWHNVAEYSLQGISWVQFCGLDITLIKPHTVQSQFLTGVSAVNRRP